MHAPCNGVSRLFPGRLQIILIPFVLNDFRYAASGFTADESLEERGSRLILPDESKIRG